MSIEILLGVLAFGTMGAFAVFGLWSKNRTDKRREKDVPKSTLAEDAPNTR